MASEIRVNKINSLSGVGTFTLSPTGVDIAGITTAATLRATTGIVTSLTSGSLTSLSDVKVGSGVTLSPDGDVSITGVTTFTGHIDASSDVFISDKIIHAGDTDTAIRFSGADTITAETGGSERLRIASDGNMGLGTNSLVGNAANVYLTINGSTLGGIALKANGTTQGYLQGTSSLIRLSSDGSKPITFDTNGSERLRITDDGKVGINQTPTRELSVHSPNNNNALIHFTNDDTGETAADGILVGLDGNENMVINNQETGKTINFYNGGSERLNIDSSGNLEIVDGNLKVASGHGIDFSATGDGPSMGNELFEDYEEGSYTPALSFSGTTYTYGSSNDYTFRSPHSTSDNNSISYVKIGTMVYLNFAIFWNSTITARYVMTLPFTARGSAYALCITPTSFRVEISGDTLGTLGTGNNSTSFDTFRVTGASSNGGHGNIPLTTHSEVYYQICYEAL